MHIGANSRYYPLTVTDGMSPPFLSPVRLVVGIGASAGGLEALRSFFSATKETQHIAYIVIQHTDISGQSLALDVIGHLSSMPVVEIADGLPLKGGTVFVAPPHMLISLSKGIFHLELAADRSQRLATIDWCFRSLAQDQQQHSVGVVLSGEGLDGTLGLKAISEAGGMTMAQAPESAQYLAMPQSGISSGIVDHVLRPDEMPAELSSYEKYVTRMLDEASLSSLREEVGAALTGICEILQKVTHHDFKHYKTSTLVRRIQRRMQVLQLNSVASYVERLSSHPDEVEALFKELLINVTNFFRDPEAFLNLKDVIKTALEKKPPHERFRIWIAGCSTGEEAYSIGILVKEALAELSLSVEVQIIATDIDETALNVARKGDYPMSIAENISPERLSRFFVRRGGRYHVVKELRELCLFSSHNLINDPPFSQLDLISCRNVLIYLGPHLQKKLIPVFHYALKPSGYLFLGTSETLSAHKELFRTVSAKYRIAQRKATSIRAQASFSGTMGTSYAAHFQDAAHGHESDLHLVAQRIVLDEFSPKYAIVNEDFQVMSVSAGIHLYFEPSEGTFQNHIVKLIKPSLRVALRSALTQARKLKRKIDNDSTTLKVDESLKRIGITVQPMPQLGEDSSLFMVVFRDLGPIAFSDEQTTSETSSVANHAVVEQLERELLAVRSDLDKTVQDLEASNEELKSSNEELLSMNEELQSANEELEAAKEEVQTSNETLQRNNNDLENLLASTQIATLFLDDNLCIRSFTPAATDIYRVVNRDIGRSIYDFACHAVAMPRYGAPSEYPVDRPTEVEVQIDDGRVFLRRIVPYKNQDGSREGIVVNFIDVTLIRRSEGMFQNLANTLPAMAWTADARGEVNFFNKEWYAYTGLSPLETFNSGWLNAIHPKDLPSLLSSWKNSVQTGQFFEIECRVKGKVQNDYRWFLFRAQAQAGKTGEILSWCGTCVDIENQKIVQTQAWESEKKFRQLANSLPQIVWTASPDGYLDYYNERWYEFTGFERNRGGDESWEPILHPDDVQRCHDTWDASIKSGQPYEIEYRFKDRTHGGYRWFLGRAVPAYNEAGEIVKWYGSCTDVQKQKALEEAKYESELRFRFMADSTPVMIWLAGPDKRINWFNREWLKFTGRSLEAEIGGGWSEGIHPDDLEICVKTFSLSFESRSEFYLEYRRRDHTGKYRWLAANGVPRLTPNGTFEGYIGVCADIHELKEARVAAEAASEAKTLFLANMSHEIRTPLAAILGFSDLLSEMFETEEHARRYVDRISRNAKQLSHLIDEILDLSKIEARRLDVDNTLVNIRGVVDDVFAAVGMHAKEKNLEFKETWVGEVPEQIFTDPYRLRQILINVVGNAVKFTDEGAVHVELHVFEENNDQKLRVRVMDTGIGLDQEQRQRIFSPFIQADNSITRKYGGTGLGLILSRELARLLGGDLVLESSEPGRGSVFVLTVCLNRKDLDLDASSESSLSLSAPMPLGQRKILIVDDSPDNQAVIGLFLSKAGAICETANDGEEGIKLALSKEFDLILMDLQMPRMDGYQAVRILKELGYKKPIVALTAHALKAEKTRCLQAGFNEYLTKPIDRNLLIRTIARLD